MNASNISNSRFSLDTYISFAHKLNDWTPVKDNIFNALKIYDLNLKYEANDKTIIWLGRKVNPKISSLGAIDGVQFEMNFDHFSGVLSVVFDRIMSITVLTGSYWNMVRL